jgi:iron complex transport system substrate-binding protein
MASPAVRMSLNPFMPNNRKAEPTMRIVSLLASATEMIAELGCLDQLVGRSHECDYPPQVQRLPLISTVQINTETSSAEIDAQIKQLASQKQTAQNNTLKALSIYSINVELLQKLQPDIIFTQTQCEVCAVSEHDVVAALQQLTGLRPRIISLSPYTLNDVWEDIMRVGQALGRQEQATTLVTSYKNRLANLQNRTAILNEGKPRPRVAILEWLDPLMGAGNWTPELVMYAGGESIFGESGMHSPWLSWQELLNTDPDVLILAPCGFSLTRTLSDLPLLQRHPAWQSLQAVKQSRVYVIDGNYYLNRSGPRLVESAELVAHVIWGKRLGLTVDSQGWLHL